MARQKKQYPPIEGQTWWEKVLDRMTREDSFHFSMILLSIYILLLLIPVYFMSTNPNSPYAAETFMKFWFGFFLPVSALAMFNPCSTGWGFRMGQKLQQPIKEYVELCGRCTYNELVAHFMPIKIHLGIDDALAHLWTKSVFRTIFSKNGLFILESLAAQGFPVFRFEQVFSKLPKT